jgi:hypothetical protein
VFKYLLEMMRILLANAAHLTKLRKMRIAASEWNIAGNFVIVSCLIIPCLPGVAELVVYNCTTEMPSE